MDKKQTAQAIAIMQAYIDGKQIEYRVLSEHPDKWEALKSPPKWNWLCLEYRIKPETVRYRRALLNNTGHIFLHIVYEHHDPKETEKSPWFVRWIDKDWIEETV